MKHLPIVEWLVSVAELKRKVSVGSAAGLLERSLLPFLYKRAVSQPYVCACPVSSSSSSPLVFSRAVAFRSRHLWKLWRELCALFLEKPSLLLCSCEVSHTTNWVNISLVLLGAGRTGCFACICLSSSPTLTLLRQTASFPILFL